MNYVTIKLSQNPPIASVEQNGERARSIFSERWPIVHRLLQLEIENEANVNSEHDGSYPDPTKMTGDAEIQSIEYGADFRGEPVATYLVRCNARDGGFYLTIEVVLSVHAGENIFVKETQLSATS